MLHFQGTAVDTVNLDIVKLLFPFSYTLERKCVRGGQVYISREHVR